MSEMGVRPLLFITSSAAVGAALVLAGCGGKKAAAPATSAAPTTSSAAAPPTIPSASALQAEATSAATGDIPDNQVFITFRNRRTGYSMKYPEGWAQQGAGAKISFRDKNNVVRVVVASGRPPSAGAIRAGLHGAKLVSGPTRTTISGAPAWKVTYTTQSAPNPVTGKRVVLLVDRYYLARGGKEAIVDLGTPKGVDNVDAYRLMIESFRWR
jgi:hypothetical protein